jgi:hypothetical protein
MKNVIGFSASIDVVVVEQDPEFADVSNPRGNIYGFASYVVAEDADGNRRRLHVATRRWQDEALAPAEKLAAALNARLARGKLPVRFDAWREARPCYGSRAYEAYGAADDIERERNEEFAL